MPYVQIREFASLGLFEDTPAHELPPSAFTTLSNVQVVDGVIERMHGVQEVLGTPSVVPYWAFPAPSTGNLYWLYTNNAKVYTSSGGTHSNITRQTAAVDVNYTATLDDKWSSAWMNGVLYLNNPRDVPQVWAPIDPTNRLEDLPAWPATYRAKVFRQFGNFPMAANITKGSDNFPTLVKWAHPADPGATSVTWDETDTTKLAGEYPLSDSPGAIVDMLAMRQSQIIYKEDAIIAMTPSFDNDVFRFDTLSNTQGALNTGCVVEIKPGVHVALSLEGNVNLITSTGAELITMGKTRRAIQRALEHSYRSRAFVCANPRLQEVYIGIPNATTGYVTQLYVVNWETGTWVVRDIDPCLYLVNGPLDLSQVSEAWNDDVGTWDEDDSSWGEQLFGATRYNLVGGFPTKSKFGLSGSGTTLIGDAFTTRVERKSIGVVGTERDGSLRMNYQRRKIITEVWPSIEAPVGTVFQVSVGGQETPEGPITWQGPFDFTVGTDRKVDFLVDSYFPAVRFDCSAAVAWRLISYGLNVNLVGDLL